MKKLIITCALLTAASIVSFAQDTKAPTPQPMPHNGLPVSTEQMAMRRSKMDEKMYNLTPEQTKGAYDIELEFTKTMEKFRAMGQPVSKNEQVKMQQTRDAKMKTLLNAEQYAKYDAQRSRERMAPMTPEQQQQQPMAKPQQH